MTNEDREYHQVESISQRHGRIIRMIGSVRQELSLVIDIYRKTEDSTDTHPQLKQEALHKLQAEINSLDNRIHRLELELNIIRPENQRDMNYRNHLKQDFAMQLNALAVYFPELRFHASNIIASLEIITSKQISSSGERGLGQSSFDLNGQISVTGPDGVQLSINDYLGIKDKMLPLGCMFVILPKDNNDAHSVRSFLMGSLKLTNDADKKRLVAVLTSPENLKQVRTVLENSGFDKSLAMEFFAFINHLKNKVTAKQTQTSAR